MDTIIQWKNEKTRENENMKTVYTYSLYSLLFQYRAFAPSSFIHSLTVIHVHSFVFTFRGLDMCALSFEKSTYRTGTSDAGTLRPSGWTPTLVSNIRRTIA